MKTVPLEEVAGINPKPPRISDDTEVIFVGMADLNATHAKTESVSVRPFAEVSKGYTVFEDGDILVAKITPCFENNKIGQAFLHRDYGVGSTEFHVIRPGEHLDDRYILHFLRQDRVRHQGEVRMTGSAGQRRVPADFLKQLEVPLPPLDEQRRIAAILDQADGLRSKRQNVIEHSNRFAKSIFVEMFGGPIRNRMGFPIAKLGEVGELDRGVSRHRPRNDPALLGGPYPLIQTGDVTRSGGRITDYSATYSELGLAQSKLWPAGTLCITIAANIAQTGVLTFDACFPDSVVGFTADKAVATYIRVWLNFLQPTLEASAPQSAQRNINLAILRGLPVPLPEREQLEQFDDLVDRVQHQQQMNRDILVQDDDLFTSLQSRAFSGQL